MITLEQRSKICATKLRVMRQPTVNEDQYKCFNCEGLNESCNRYIPVVNTQIPVRQGSLSYLLSCIRRA